MRNPFHHDVAKSRVNLSVDVKIDGKTKTVSLPHKTLVMGDFSAGKNPAPLQDRERHKVTKETFDAVMKDIAPQLQLHLHDRTVDLAFHSLQDFHPEALALQLPTLKRLLAIRNLLKDLRAHMSDNHALKEALKKMLQSPEQIKLFQDDLNQLMAIVGAHICARL